MSKFILPSLRMLLFMTLVTGIAYPLVITVAAKGLFREKAEGSLIRSGDKVIGSALIAQKFEGPKYFWPRPSACDFNPLPSGASNLGPISADLLRQVQDRVKKLREAHGDAPIPQDLLSASGSGLDPEISPAAADYQVQRVASARGMSVETVKTLIKASLERRQWGFLGEPRVNVVKLNLALDNSVQEK